MAVGTVPQAPPPALGAMPPEPPRRGWWMTWRFLVAAVGIVLISGGATAAIALNEVGRLVEALEQHKPLKVARSVLAPTSRGQPETLLLVGNDERKLSRFVHNEVLPHSNEMLLVRIDPSKPTISMLSIPRELKVPIDLPGGGIEENRINAAFTYGWENGGGMAGGVKLMLETIKNVLGITVNHVFISNFHKFAKAVNAMGCVYLTVDKRYYHVNEPGGEQYFEINLKPGYQKLCGKEALEFVANRHESTSLIRDARDQRFLLEAKAQYGPSLVSSREKFEEIFGKYVQSTLSNEDEILQLLYLLIESAGKPVRQVHFPVNLEPTFDSATPEQIHEAVTSFMGGTAAIHRRKLRVATRHASGKRASSRRRHTVSLGFALTPTTSTELAEARAQAPNLPFPLEYPRERDARAGAEPDELRLYHTRDLQGRRHRIYTIVIDRGELGQYYDVQGTTWTDSPLLSDPGQTVHLGPRTYELFYVGERVRTIAWREAGAVYWIENTLTNDVTPRVMLAMAQQTLPVIHTRSEPNGLPASNAAASKVNLAPRAKGATTTAGRIEALLGFIGLALVALLVPLVLARRRELHRLRDQIAQALALEARGRPVLAAAASASASTAPGGPSPGEQAPTIYRTPSSWRKIVPAVLATVALVAALVFVAVQVLHI
jgi:polyisoprenyl-teichoic acid--peptidoglycan teichoic acid transferase